jgi:N-hydroxyarylamine O-acetyltransferase
MILGLIKDYLSRIGLSDKNCCPNLTTLRKLQMQHLLHVPFENLDIRMKRPIVLTKTALYNKIVKNRRGGFCYELNGSFAGLLRELGFRVTMLSAGVAKASGGFTRDYDHMTLLVNLEEDWLVDVGFGDSFSEPKSLNESGPQKDLNGKAYRIAKLRSGKSLLLERSKIAWKPQYRFSLVARKLSDYRPRCRYQETSPNSHFRKGAFCTRMTANGRATLTERSLTVTSYGAKTVSKVKNHAEFERLLSSKFGIALPQHDRTLWKE